MSEHRFKTATTPKNKQRGNYDRKKPKFGILIVNSRNLKVNPMIPLVKSEVSTTELQPVVTELRCFHSMSVDDIIYFYLL